MKANREALVKLFSELGVKDPGAWTAARMKQKIEALPKMSKEDLATETEESKKLLDKLLEALKDGDEIALTGYDEEPTAKAEKATEGEQKAEGEEKGKKKAKKEKAEKESKGPGVISSIVEFLSKATEKKPLKKADIVEKLCARFPDRSKDSMANTVNVQVPNRIKVDKGLNVKKNDNGYWIEPSKS